MGGLDRGHIYSTFILKKQKNKFVCGIYFIKEKCTTQQNCLCSMGISISGLYPLRRRRRRRRKKKKTLISHLLWISVTYCSSIVPYRDSKFSKAPYFCLTYNTWIVKINNTIYHIIISHISNTNQHFLWFVITI